MNVLLKGRQTEFFWITEARCFEARPTQESPCLRHSLWDWENNVASAVMARGSLDARWRGFEALTCSCATWTRYPTVPERRRLWVILHAMAALSWATVSQYHAHASGDVRYWSAHRCTQWCIIIMKSGMCKALRLHLISMWEETALISWKHLMSWWSLAVKVFSIRQSEMCHIRIQISITNTENCDLISL